MKLRCYCIHGLAGGPPLYLSGGMDTLAVKLTAAGVPCTVHEQGSFFRPYGEVSTIFADALHAAKSGASVILIGHSMGADAALKVAVKLHDVSVTVQLVACFDPTSFRLALGPPAVPANVARVICFYQKVDPIGRGILRPGRGFAGQLVQERHDQPHVSIDDDPVLHARVLTEVRRLTVH